MAGISINFLADVKNFLRGTKNVEDELENVADSLDDMAKDGDKAAEKIEKSFRDLARETKQTGDTMSTGMKGGFDKTRKHGEDAATEIKDEFKSNLSEVTSSFDGSVESMGDLVQGTLGGLVGSLGPLGVAAGAAGALGVGVIIAEITKAAEEAEAAKQRISELGAAMIDAASNGEVPLELVIDNLKSIVTNSEDAAKKFTDIQKEAEDLGLSAEALASAYAGGDKALKDQLDALDTLIEQEEERYQQELNNHDTFMSDAQQKIAEYELQRRELSKVAEETAKAAEAERDWLASGGAEMLGKQQAIETINAAYDQAAGSILDFKNEETGVLDIEAFINSIEERKNSLQTYQTDLATMGLTTEQKSALDSVGLEAAMAYLDGIKNGTPEQAEYLKNSLTETASDASGLAVEEIETAFKTPIEAKVDVTANTKKATESIDAWINRTRYVDVIARIRDEDGRVYN